MGHLMACGSVYKCSWIMQRIAVQLCPALFAGAWRREVREERVANTRAYVLLEALVLDSSLSAAACEAGMTMCPFS